MTKHLIVTGKVQGVGYRAAFEAQARALGLSGWVRNRLDGSVEALVAGEPAALEQIVAWAGRGPSHAEVRNVTIADVTDSELLDPGFVVRPTI